MPKKCQNFRNFWTKVSLELTEGWTYSQRLAYPIIYILAKNSAAFRSSSGSSLFQKIVCKFIIFNDYVIAHDVIGHDVIGHQDIAKVSALVYWMLKTVWSYVVFIKNYGQIKMACFWSNFELSKNSIRYTCLNISKNGQFRKETVLQVKSTI